MQPSRFALLVCAPALAITAALGADPVQAADTDPDAVYASQPITLEFHPLRASAASKRSGGSLKPDIDAAAPLAVNASLRMHVHADGAVSYDCSEQHAEASRANKSEKPQ